MTHTVSKRTKLLALCLVVAFGVWVLSDIEITEQTVPVDYTSEHIKHVGVDIVDGQIQMDVSLHQYMTCNEAVQELEVVPFEFREKIFVPHCAEISDILIRIIYVEFDSV